MARIRRREARKARELARLLVALDAEAAAVRRKRLRVRRGALALVR
jgi:hypothetical protein